MKEPWWIQARRATDPMLCPRCGGEEAFHPSPGDCGITPEEWRRGKAAQRTVVAIFIVQAQCALRRRYPEAAGGAMNVRRDYDREPVTHALGQTPRSPREAMRRTGDPRGWGEKP